MRANTLERIGAGGGPSRRNQRLRPSIIRRWADSIELRPDSGGCRVDQHKIPPSDAATVAIRRTSEHLFFTGLGVVSSLLMFAGFAPTFYLRPFFRAQDYLIGQVLSRDGLPPIVWAHGLVLTLWLALFVAQTLLVATSRTPTHRRLGVFGGVIAVAIVIVGVATATESARQMTLTGESAAASVFATGATAFAVFRYVGGGWFAAQATTRTSQALHGSCDDSPVASGAITSLRGVGITPRGRLGCRILLAFSVAIFDRLSQRRVYSVSLWGAGLRSWPPLLGAGAGALPAWQTFTGWA